MISEQETLNASIPFLNFVYKRPNPDGTPHYLMVSRKPKFDSSGRFTGYRWVDKNVTYKMRSDGCRVYSPIPSRRQTRFLSSR